MFHSQLEREAYIKDMEDRLLKEFHKKKRPKEKSWLEQFAHSMKLSIYKTKKRVL